MTGKDWKHGNTEDGGTGNLGAVFIVNDNGSIQVSQILLNFFCSPTWIMIATFAKSPIIYIHKLKISIFLENAHLYKSIKEIIYFILEKVAKTFKILKYT